MQRKRVFISSVWLEFAEERQMLFEYLTSDALLGRFFEPFISERFPDAIPHPVKDCDIYLGIFGRQYSQEIEKEFDAAAEENKTCLVFVKQTGQRELGEELFIAKAENAIVRRNFSGSADLRAAVYASLTDYLVRNEIIRTTPFDATIHPEATIADLDAEGIRNFAERAQKRDSRFNKNSNIADILSYLNLVRGERVTNAALLLFAKTPQRFIDSSKVQCLHYNGFSATAPVLLCQTCKGTIFEMIRAATDFVIACVRHELPVLAITEAIVNAVAHRDYTSDASVQVMLFSDRLEISNPGRLPAALTIERLFAFHSSVPANPLLAESLFLYGAMERMGTGTEDIVRSCREMGLKRPDFVQDAEFRTVFI